MKYHALVLGSVLLLASWPSMAIDPHQCDFTVGKCVGEVVDLANKIMIENESLEKRIAQLNADLADAKKDYNQKIKDLSDATDQKLAALRQELTQNENQIRSNVKAWLPGDAYSNGGAQCPTGYYMVGLNADASSGGPHGIIYAIHALCRQINS